MQNTHVIRPRALSKNEARLVSHLEFERQRLVTIKQAGKILGSSDAYARFVLFSLTRKGWLVPVRRGLFELLPAASGGYWARDWFVLLQAFRKPYYLSFLSAAYLLGLSAQKPALAQVSTPKLVRARYARADGNVEQVVVGELRFFGFEKTQRDGLEINIAEPAKAIIDCLYLPRKAGGIIEAARILTRGTERIPGNKLAQYAMRMNNRALAQRLGYLTDSLELRFAESARSLLRRYVSSGGRQHVFLGSVAIFGRKGEWNATWRITDNIGRDRLRKELEF